MLFGNSKTPQEESRDMFHLERTGANIMKARKNGLSDIVSLAPFLSGGVLRQIAGELLRTGKLTDITPCCPFGTAASSKPIWKTNTDPGLSRPGAGGLPQRWMRKLVSAPASGPACRLFPWGERILNKRSPVL